MKKLLVILLVLLTIAGCAKPAEEGSENQQEEVTEATALKMIAPTGAPALSLVNYVEEFGNESIETVAGSDGLQAALSTDGYDAIIAPINLGVNVIKKAGTTYRLVGVVTWGNLYLVKNEGVEDGIVALFGENAVPGKVISAIDYDFGKEPNWYAAVSDVTPVLLSGEASLGLLAEPALTAAMAKSKEANVTLSVVADVQALYNEKYGTSGYPQAALFVSEAALKERSADVDALLQALSSVTADDMSKIEGTEDFYGVPSAAIAGKAFNGMNVRFTAAKEADKEIGAFLKLFGIEEYQSVLAENE